ncbi:MAG TPA: hypothetical protein VJV75_01160 [Candidatus Polarisedimenticolia bacterium]|nr:hypothetical protein [Candidatus Polarisedimenticolia bacterium]
MLRGVQFIVDQSGRKTAVVIDLLKNPELWEDFYDQSLAARRRREPRESLARVMSRLRLRAPAPPR